MEVLADLWRRATVTTPVLEWQQAALAGLAALAVLVFVWKPARMPLTVCHEAGHALVALLTGRRLRGIRLHADTSGLTRTSGPAGGFGQGLIFFAGYPAPALAGLAAAAAVRAGHAAGLLWTIVLLSAVMLLGIRNWYGALAMVVIGGGLALTSWFAPASALGWVAAGVAWLLLLGAPRVVLEAFRDPKGKGSDADQLAARTHVPRVVWLGLWLLITVGCLALGGFWLLPGLPLPG